MDSEPTQIKIANLDPHTPVFDHYLYKKKCEGLVFFAWIQIKSSKNMHQTCINLNIFFQDEGASSDWVTWGMAEDAEEFPDMEQVF